jgi:hypothetical protein
MARDMQVAGVVLLWPSKWMSTALDLGWRQLLNGCTRLFSSLLTGLNRASPRLFEFFARFCSNFCSAFTRSVWWY